MSLRLHVSVVRNVLKQRTRFERVNVRLLNRNGLCGSEKTQFYATNVRDKLFFIDNDGKSNCLRYYSIQSFEMRGPVQMTMTDAGKLHISIVDDFQPEKVVDNVSSEALTSNPQIESNHVDTSHVDNDTTSSDSMTDSHVDNDTTSNDNMTDTDNTNSLETELKEFIKKNQIDTGDSAIDFLNLTSKLLSDLLVPVDDHLQFHNFLITNQLYMDYEIYFLRNLTIAFHESGRITEAVEYLKTLCKNNQDYSKIQKTFIYITSMILKEFPQFQSDIVSMVDRYKVSKFSQLERDLWKCFILSENFKEAENYRQNLKNYNPDQLNTDVQSILRIKHMFSDFEYVTKYLLISGEGWGLKKGLLMEIYENYLSSLSNKKKYREVIFHLNKAKMNNIKIDHKIFSLLCHYIDLSGMTEVEKASFKSLKNWYSRPVRSEQRLNLQQIWSESK